MKPEGEERMKHRLRRLLYGSCEDLFPLQAHGVEV